MPATRTELFSDNYLIKRLQLPANSANFGKQTSSASTGRGDKLPRQRVPVTANVGSTFEDPSRGVVFDDRRATFVPPVPGDDELVPLGAELVENLRFLDRRS